MANKIRILFYAEAFLPPAYLPRIRYFCYWLSQKGWEIDLIIEQSAVQKLVPTDINVVEIKYYKYTRGIKARIEWLLKFLLNLLFDYKGIYFYRKSKKFTDGKQYDLVLCSSSFTFPITTARMVARARQIPLVVDLRDIIEQSPNDNHYIAQTPPKWLSHIIIPPFKQINVRRRNRVLRVADEVISVSPWHAETLSKYNKASNLIYNGFDERIFIPQALKSETFTISYFGRVYNRDMRNPDLLFEAIRNLRQKKMLPTIPLVINWFVDEKSEQIIHSIAMEYGLEKYMHYNAFVSPNEMITEMNKSAVLLTLSNIQTKQQYFGIMTTKFFESIGVNRPILCIPDNKDTLSELIMDSNCGLVSSDVSEIEKYLLANMAQWQKEGRTSGYLSDTERMNFSRRNGAEILENILMRTINKHHDTV